MLDAIEAGRKADELIATEVSVQDKMWGNANERADAYGQQLLGAAMAQIHFVAVRAVTTDDAALMNAKSFFYPKDWDNAAFRSYGSNVANLVVAAAFIRSEIKRLIAAGEDTTRTKRGEPYTTALPNMSSEQAGAQS